MRPARVKEKKTVQSTSKSVEEQTTDRKKKTPTKKNKE